MSEQSQQSTVRQVVDSHLHFGTLRRRLDGLAHLITDSPFAFNNEINQ
jgi:hypothetical protein